MTVKEQRIIAELLRKVVANMEALEAIRGDNPQIAAVKAKAAGKREVAEAVIRAMGGDLVILKIMGM